MNAHESAAASDVFLKICGGFFRPRLAVVIRNDYVIVAELRSELRHVLTLAWRSCNGNFEAAATFQRRLNQRSGCAPVVIVLTVDNQSLQLAGLRGRTTGQKELRQKSDT